MLHRKVRMAEEPQVKFFELFVQLPDNIKEAIVHLLDVESFLALSATCKNARIMTQKFCHPKIVVCLTWGLTTVARRLDTRECIRKHPIDEVTGTENTNHTSFWYQAAKTVHIHNACVLDPSCLVDFMKKEFASLGRNKLELKLAVWNAEDQYDNSFAHEIVSAYVSQDMFCDRGRPKCILDLYTCDDPGLWDGSQNALRDVLKAVTDHKALFPVCTGTFAPCAPGGKTDTSLDAFTELLLYAGDLSVAAENISRESRIRVLAITTRGRVPANLSTPVLHKLLAVPTSLVDLRLCFPRGTVFQLPPTLPTVRHLELEGTIENLDALPHVCPNLVELRLRNTRAPEGLAPSVPMLPNLRQLHVTAHRRGQKPTFQGSLPRLQQLTCTHVADTLELPLLPALKQAEFGSCALGSSLETLPRTCPALERLELSFCKKVSGLKLPDTQRVFSMTWCGKHTVINCLNSLQDRALPLRVQGCVDRDVPRAFPRSPAVTYDLVWEDYW